MGGVGERSEWNSDLGFDRRPTFSIHKARLIKWVAPLMSTPSEFGLKHAERVLNV